MHVYTFSLGNPPPRDVYKITYQYTILFSGKSPDFHFLMIVFYQEIVGIYQFLRNFCCSVDEHQLRGFFVK